MLIAMETTRLFFGFQVKCPWPEEFPNGRILSEENRHLTLAFLGDVSMPDLEILLPSFPKPSLQIGLAGFFDEPIFLPPRSPRVAAWHVQWLKGGQEWDQYASQVMEWLSGQGLPHKHQHESLPHVTIARRPFSIHEWRHSFESLPMFLGDLHLCQSLGASRYETCWTYPILPPFEEVPHTADLAFLIRGSDFNDLLLHAQLALSFHFPRLISYFLFIPVASLDAIIRCLNQIVAKVDEQEGAPFKAVSLHGALKEGAILEWEMIVDV